MLALCALVPVDARKKTKAEPLLFPDGTPVPEWFKEAEAPAPESLGKLYNIADYGAISDPVNVQTELIQSVIDKAAEEGGGVVVIPEGIYKSGALFFRQGTHLHLLRGAVLLGSEHIYDFPVVMTRIEGEVCKYFPALINADGLDGFTLTGCGTIDGNGSPYWKAFRIRRQWNPKCTNKDEQRPRLLHVSNSRNVTIADVTLQNSPFWTCHIYKTDHIKLLNLRIFSPREPIKSASADGIDLDVCSNVHVKGCRITVNDDAICFKGGKGPWADKDENNGPNSNILVEECFFDRTTGSCVTCGSECIQTHNILIRNCKVDRARTRLSTMSISLSTASKAAAAACSMSGHGSSSSISRTARTSRAHTGSISYSEISTSNARASPRCVLSQRSSLSMISLSRMYASAPLCPNGKVLPSAI